MPCLKKYILREFLRGSFLSGAEEAAGAEVFERAVAIAGTGIYKNII